MLPSRSAIAALAALLCAAAPEPASVDGLGWLAGDWVSEVNGRWTEELWSKPRGGLMLGVGRSGKADRAMGFEFMRITADGDGHLIFWGAPGGQSPVAFRLVSQDETTAVFENPRHDFPKRVVYRRDGRTLVATVSGDGDDQQSWTYERREPVATAASQRK